MDEDAVVNTNEADEVLDFGLSPNPTDDWVRLRLPNDLSSATSVRLMTINGQLLRQNTIGAGSQEWLFSTGFSAFWCVLGTSY